MTGLNENGQVTPLRILGLSKMAGGRPILIARADQEKDFVR